MTEDEALAKHKPVFELREDTEVRQLWFVGSNERDVMGILYKDEKGWLLRYRFREYAEPISKHWDTPGTVEASAWDGKDRKRIFDMRPNPEQEVTEISLLEISQKFTLAMSELVKMMKAYDPEAFLWTKRVSTTQEVTDALLNQSWAHARREEDRDTD